LDATEFIIKNSSGDFPNDGIESFQLEDFPYRYSLESLYGFSMGHSIGCGIDDFPHIDFPFAAPFMCSAIFHGKIFQVRHVNIFP